MVVVMGHEVRVLDLDLEIKDQDHPSGHYVDVFADSIRDFSPQVVGLTSMYSNSLQAERLIRCAKVTDASVATVAGGSHFGALGKEALRRIPELDYVIEGEAEGAISALLNGESIPEIPRLHYRKAGELRANPRARTEWIWPKFPPMWSNLDGAIRLERYRATSSIFRFTTRRVRRGRPQGIPVRLHFLRDRSFLGTALPG